MQHQARQQEMHFTTLFVAFIVLNLVRLLGNVERLNIEWLKASPLEHNTVKQSITLFILPFQIILVINLSDITFLKELMTNYIDCAKPLSKININISNKNLRTYTLFHQSLDNSPRCVNSIFWNSNNNLSIYVWSFALLQGA